MVGHLRRVLIVVPVSAMAFLSPHAVTVTGAGEVCEIYYECTGWDGDHCYQGYWYEQCYDDGQAEQDPTQGGSGGGSQSSDLPTGEVTSGNGWRDFTLHDWVQALTGEWNFGGRVVTERDPGGGGPDTCWFPLSEFASASSLTGGTWTVYPDNRWGPDSVGWTHHAVDYYRNQNRAPCETSFGQDMEIDRPGNSPVIYASHLLRMGIRATTVWSERAGQYAERSY